MWKSCLLQFENLVMLKLLKCKSDFKVKVTRSELWHTCTHVCKVFIRPPSDGTYYGMVMSVHPSIWVSVLVFVRPSQFSALFSYMLWHIELKFCMSLSSYEHSIKFEYGLFPSVFFLVMPLLELSILEMHSFPHLSLTCFDILSWNFAYDSVCCTTVQVWLSSICANFYMPDLSGRIMVWRGRLSVRLSVCPSVCPQSL